MSWISKIFGTKKTSKKVKKISDWRIDSLQITTDWNADPVSPEIELKIDGIDLIMEIYLNHYQFNQFNEGDKVKIRFKDCAKYSLNTCNDEGYNYGQYRIKPTELVWGEFYEIKNGLDRNMPHPVVKIQNDNQERKHFLFFFKDETFECLASDFELLFINNHIKSELIHKKNYKIVLDGKEIGTSKLEKADAPMGVVFGRITFNGIESPYQFFKNYCLKNNIIVNTEDSEFEFIDTQVMSELKVFRDDGLEIKGVTGNAVTGMKIDGYEISILGISYPFYEAEFPHHVKAYESLFNKE